MNLHPDTELETSQPEVLKTSLRGRALLRHRFLNKGSAFTHQERAALRLEGLLPHHVSTMEEQVERIYRGVMRSEDPLDQHMELAALHDRNEHLFYRLLIDHLEAFMPVVYTPTVGLVCQRFSYVFREARGIWLTPDHAGRIDEILGGLKNRDVRLIVVTDNERILGLGDQGAGGMGIPVGKLTLYTAAAGIHPRWTLPVSLDVGTDNPVKRADPLYLGWQQPRLRGAPYDALVEEFVQAVKRRFPRALLQWEDFKKTNALRLLDRYRHELPCFNDDIQGTASVAVAGILAGSRAVGLKLSEHRFVIAGAGAAGIGIARLLRSALRRRGLDGADIQRRIALLDSHGLLEAGRWFGEDEYKREFAWPTELLDHYGLSAHRVDDLQAVVRQVEPTVLIGTTGQPGCFTEPVIRTMAANVRQPLIFPLSNPTSKAEARPADLLAWSEGRALVATGSPFDPVVHDGRTREIGQANNVYAFPGIGLGVLVSHAREVTGGMFTTAAETLAQQVSQAELDAGRMFPSIERLRSVSARIACAVAREAREAGVGESISDDDIPRRVRAAMWEPVYPVLEPTAAPGG